jgi:hypothetical protein
VQDAMNHESSNEIKKQFLSLIGKNTLSIKSSI